MTLARAFAFDVIMDTVGNVIQGATVTVREPGTTTNISETMFDSVSGVSTLTNPLTTDSQGIIQFWLSAPKTVDLYVTGPGISAFTRRNIPVLPDLGDVILSEGNQSIAGPIAIDGLSVTNGVWTNGTITSPTISGPTITGNVPGLNLSDNLLWGTGYAGDLIQSLENSFDSPLQIQGEATATAIGIQRGSLSSVATPSNNQQMTNFQAYINPNAAVGATGSTWYRYGRRIGAGNMYAWYADLSFIWADNTTTDYNGGSDNVAGGRIARNTYDRPSRVWGGYDEVRAYSATASAIGLEVDVWNASQGKAGMPWSAEVNRLAGIQVVGNAEILYSASIRGSRYHTGSIMLFSAEEGQSTAQRSAFRVGIHARPDSIRKTGTDSALIAALEARYSGTSGLHGSSEDSAGYLIHAGAIDPTSRFGLMQHGGKLWAAVNGWTSSSAYSTELPLIGTETGNNTTYVYGKGGSIQFVADDGAAVVWTGFSASELAMYAGQYSLYNVTGANYERAAITWGSNVMRWAMEKGGSGSAREQRWATGGTDLLSLGTTGILSTMNSRRAMFKQPSVRAYHNTTQSLTNITETLLVFNNERFDQDGNGNAANMHDLISNTGRLVAPIAGRYLVTCTIEIAANSIGERILWAYLNAGTVIDIDTKNASSGQPTRLNIATVYQFAANDFVEFHAYQSSGGSLNVLSSGNYSPEATLTYLSD